MVDMFLQQLLSSWTGLVIGCIEIGRRTNPVRIWRSVWNDKIAGFHGLIQAGRTIDQQSLPLTGLNGKPIEVWIIYNPASLSK